MNDNHKVFKDFTGQRLIEAVRDVRNVLADQHSGVIYGFHIDSTESDPEDCITYLADAVGMTPAYMDTANDRFIWGSWRDAFFMPRPCMLKYDGTVDYYLDENDFTKKYDGTPSDVADINYEGNAMVEWGQNGKIIWYKIVPDAEDNTSASVYIADYQADDDFHCWSFINSHDEIVDHFYTSIYNGSLDTNGKLRSISGRTYDQLCQSKTSAQEVAAAKLNSVNTDEDWNIEVYADIMLIDLLLILIGKTLDVKTAFGSGRCGQSSSASNMLSTGTMNTKGLFWGDTVNGTYGVKVFGMENYWGNQWRRYVGHIMNDYVQKYKLTYGQLDGSTGDGYQTSGTASDYSHYITGATAPSSNNYVKTMQFDSKGVFQNKEVQSSSSLYWCAYFYQNSGLRLAFRGAGCSDPRTRVSPWCVCLNGAPSNAYWFIGASPSYKPL